MGDKFMRSSTNRGAVVNTDAEGLLAYKRQKARFADIGRVIEDNKRLESEISEIKSTLAKILSALEKI